MSKITIRLDNAVDPVRVWLRVLCVVMVAYAFFGGAVSLTGWVVDVQRLTDWGDHGISIQPNTPVAVMAACLALAFLWRGFHRVGRGLALITFAIGTLSLFQVISGITLPINTWLMFDRQWGAAGTVAPGQIGPPGSTSWTLIGVSIFLISMTARKADDGSSKWIRLFGVGCALGTLSISALSITGYMFGAEALYAIPRYTVIAFQTATFIFAISVAIILSVSDVGPMRLFTDDSIAGSMVRRVVPAVIVVPVLLGLVRLAGERSGFYDLAFGTAARTLIEISFLLVLLWWAGRNVNLQERRAELSLLAAQESDRELSEMANAMPQVVWIANDDGEVVYYNQRVAGFGGVQKIGESRFDWQPVVHPDDAAGTLAAWDAAVSSGNVYTHEHRILMADDTYRWHLSRAIPATPAEGSIGKWYGTATDIHDLKLVEAEFRRTEERLRLAVEAGRLGVWESAPNSRELYWDDRTRELFGVSEKVKVEYDDTIWNVVPEEDHALIRLAEAKAFDIDGDGIFDTEHRVRLSDGSFRWLHQRGRVDFSSDSGTREAVLLRGTVVDVTERKHEDTRLALLARLGDLIRTSEDSEHLLFYTCQAVGDSMNAQRCLFNEIDLDARTETVHRDYSRSGESIAGTHVIGGYSPATMEEMSVGKTVVNYDSMTDPRTEALYDTTYGPAGERSYVAVPLIRGGRWVASFWISDDEPRVWTEPEVRSIESIAERTWLAVERIRNAEELLLSQKTFYSLIQKAPFGIFVIDSDLRFAQISDFSKKVFEGIDPLIGRDLGEVMRILWSEPFASEVIEHFRHTLETGDEYHSPDTTETRADTEETESYDWILKRIALPDGRHGVAAYFYDMTAHKRAEMMIRRREQRLTISTEAAELGVFEWKVKDDITIWEDERLYSIFGVTPEQAAAKPSDFFINYLHLEDVDCFRNAVDEAMVTGTMRRTYCRILRGDGETRWIEINGQFEFDDDGSPIRLVGVVGDITERQRAEQVLQQAEERRILAQEAGNVGIWDWNVKENKTYWSETMWSLYGEEPSDRNPDEVFWSSHIYEDDRERVKKRLHEVVDSEEARFREEFRIVQPDKSLRWVQSIARVVRSDDGGALRLYGVNVDISQRKEAEQKLQKSYDELDARVKERTEQLATANASLLNEIKERQTSELRRIDLLHRLVSSQEVERSRIARDIHDQLGQRLTALRMKIASLSEAAGENEELVKRIERLQEIGEKLDSEVSYLAWELRPSGLDDLGFVEAIGEYVSEWSRHVDIPAEFHASDLSGVRTARETETHLYRIAQEALNNAAKHSGADHMSVLLERRDENIILVIEDNGKGFDAADSISQTDASGGLGLVGMNERATLIGGEVEIESKPGSGTTVFVRVPMNGNK